MKPLAVAANIPAISANPYTTMADVLKRSGDCNRRVSASAPRNAMGMLAMARECAPTFNITNLWY